jgi:hypothetical protein
MSAGERVQPYEMGPQIRQVGNTRVSHHAARLPRQRFDGRRNGGGLDASGGSLLAGENVVRGDADDVFVEFGVGGAFAAEEYDAAGPVLAEPVAEGVVGVRGEQDAEPAGG